jgi:CubicO group peptidase (beta-lactamase class C family)
MLVEKSRFDSTPESVGFSSSRLQRINARMQSYIDQEKLAGMVTLVARRGQIIHFECHGQRDREAARPMEQDTIFRIYSMTKPITTVAAMMLFEEGRFRLNDPVSHYIPAFANTPVYVRSGPDGFELAQQERPMTIHDLMVHTSGLTYGFLQELPVDEMYQKAKLLDTRDYGRSLAEQVKALAEVPLAAQPGSTWRYSVSTDVLGYLIECLTDQPLGDFFAEHIFAPLGMVDTAFHVHAEKVDRLATVYGPAEEGGLKVVDQADESPFTRPPGFGSGGGGLVSTTMDYYRFCQMMLNGGELDGNRLLGRKTVELMTMNHLPPALLPARLGQPMPGSGFGLGFSVLMDVAAKQLLGSVGSYSWGGAANTTFWIDPKEELVGILMIQFMPPGTYPVNEDFHNLVYQAIDD